MKLFLLNPEVPGGLGSSTVITNRAEIEAKKARYFNVAELEYKFDGWLGDDLLTSHPCYIVTQKLADALVAAKVSGFELRDLRISKSQLFLDIHADKVLPPFKWLVPSGRVLVNGTVATEWSGDDICFSQRADLVVSPNAMDLVKKFRIQHGFTIELSLAGQN